MLRLVSKRKCPQLTLFYRSLSDDKQLSFIKKGADAKFHPLPRFGEAGAALREKIVAAGAGHYVHLTGQYYDHDPTLTRNVVMRVGTKRTGAFEPQLILDAALTGSENKVVANLLIDTKESRFVSTGEIDCVGSEDWNYGYILGPSFTIFTTESIVLQQSLSNKNLLTLHTRPGYPIGQKIWMADIGNVFVHLSPRPWATQTMGVRFATQGTEQVNILKHTTTELEGRVVDESVEPSRDELGEIMINTEWVVKAAAQLVYVALQNRLKNLSIPLYVPRIIQAELNPYVELRNSMWHGDVQDELDAARKGYVP